MNEDEFLTRVDGNGAILNAVLKRKGNFMEYVERTEEMNIDVMLIK